MDALDPEPDVEIDPVLKRRAFESVKADIVQVIAIANASLNYDADNA